MGGTGLVLFMLMAMSSESSNESLVLSFQAERREPAWLRVNDNVMGGRSRGGFRIADGRLHFTGELNTDGGGFASVRTEPWPYGFSALAGFRIRVRGDGRRYRMRLAGADPKVGYMADFRTDEGQWQTLELLLADFQPSFRGRRLALPSIAAEAIVSIGFMIADERDGPFALEVDWITAVPLAQDRAGPES